MMKRTWSFLSDKLGGALLSCLEINKNRFNRTKQSPRSHSARCSPDLLRLLAFLSGHWLRHHGALRAHLASCQPSHLTGGSERQPQPPPADTAVRQMWSRSTWWQWMVTWVKVSVQRGSACSPSNKTKRSECADWEKDNDVQKGMTSGRTSLFGSTWLDLCFPVYFSISNSHN